MFFLLVVVFDLTQMTIFCLITILYKETNFVVSLLLSKYQTKEIVRVTMSSLFSLKFFERFNARYHSNMIFTPRELFTYVVIIMLIIWMLGQLILRVVCISFSDISIGATSLRITLRWCGFSLIFPSMTSTVGIYPRELFLYLNIK